MMKNNIAMMALLVFGVIAVAGYATAAMADDLKSAETSVKPKAEKLSDEQLDRIHKIKFAYADENEMSANELAYLHQQLMTALCRAVIDKTLVASLLSKINELEAKESLSQVQMMMNIHELLSPEQKQQNWHNYLIHHVPSAEEIMLGCDEIMPPPPFGAGPPPPLCEEGLPPPPFGAGPPPPPFE